MPQTGKINGTRLSLTNKNTEIEADPFDIGKDDDPAVYNSTFIAPSMHVFSQYVSIKPLCCHYKSSVIIQVGMHKSLP